MKLLLYRHAKTPGNALGRYIGRTDEPLGAEGLRSLSLITPRHDVASVFVTPLLRTQQTAAAAFPGARQIVCPLLREMDFGRFENRNYADMELDADYRAWVDGGCLGICPEGEGTAGFSARIREGFLLALREAKALRLAEAIFVVHGGTVMAVMDAFAAEKKESFYKWSVGNLCGWSADIRFADGTPVLENAEMIRL